MAVIKASTLFTFLSLAASGILQSAGAPTIGTITGEQNVDASGVYTLTTTTSGGDPSASAFQWELSGGLIITPGYDDADYAALASSTGTTTTNALVLKNGLSSLAQSITFRASATASNGAFWWATYTFNLPSASTVTATPSVTKFARIITGPVVKLPTGPSEIAAFVSGGSPTPNTYEWTVQQPDGTFVDVLPGTGGASVVDTSSGDPQLSLSVADDPAATSWRTVTLRVSSVNNGFESWWVTNSWSIPPYGTGSEVQTQ